MQSTLADGSQDAKKFLPARQVWERYGVTSMTLWRWLNVAALKFPQPMRIGRLRYWPLSELIAWEQSRCGKSVSTINPSIKQRATALTKKEAV